MAARIDCPILSRLRKRDSGVHVPPQDDRQINLTNLTSLFQCILYEESKPQQRLVRKSVRLAYEFCQDGNWFAFRSLEQDVYNESALEAVEHKFHVSFNVYFLEHFLGSFRPALARSGGHNAIHVVYVFGRYLRIRNLAQFLRIQIKPSDSTSSDQHPASSDTPYSEFFKAEPAWFEFDSVQEIMCGDQTTTPMADPPQLRWIKKHRFIRSLKLRRRKGPVYADELNFFRCLAAHLQAQDLEGTTCRLAQMYRMHHNDEDRPRSSTDPHVRAQDQSFNGFNIFGEIDKLEHLYQIKIHIYRLENSEHVMGGFCPKLVHKSDNAKYNDTLHLLAYDAHLCYITDIARFESYRDCSKCSNKFFLGDYFFHVKRCQGGISSRITNHTSPAYESIRECDN